MYKPILLVIAGCNGSGKSSFSHILAEDNFSPFDYDLHYLQHYRSLFDSDIRDNMAHNMAFSDLESCIQNSIYTNSNFCYETNFNSSPLHWPEIFKKSKYELRLIFLCLNSIEEAKKRVAIRVENGGHFVPNNEIETRYHQGFQNLNTHFDYFHKVDLFDTSVYGKSPSHILSVENKSLQYTSSIPQYLEPLIPDILMLNK
jgi:predicted ABC-type ATPase